ncbi:MAG: hypothetical protein SGJ05_06905 [bacterium]|nr:hypothetical protein [bacterium]
MRCVCFVAVLIIVVNARADDGLILRSKISYGNALFDGDVKPILNSPAILYPSHYSFKGPYRSFSMGVGTDLNQTFTVSADIGIHSMSGSNTEPGWGFRAINPDGSYTESGLEYDLDVSVFDAFLRPAVAIQLPIGFSIELGLPVRFNVNSRIASTVRYVSAPNSRLDSAYADSMFAASGHHPVFDVDKPVRLYDQEIEDMPTVLVAFDLEIGKAFVVKDATVQILAGYRFGFAPISAVRSLRVNAIDLSLCVMYRL